MEATGIHLKKADSFRFKKGMRTKLFNQVATDNPEGTGTLSKGWEQVVNNLKTIGPEWTLLNARCAREATRDAVKAWTKEDRENRTKTGTGENETDEDEFLREIHELWKARQEEKEENSAKRKPTEREEGLALRRTATEGLKPRRLVQDENTSPEDDGKTPVKRRKHDLLEYLREIKDGERKVEMDRIAMEERRLNLQKRQFEEERQRRAREHELQVQFQRQQFQIQQQQLQMMAELMKQFTKQA